MLEKFPVAPVIVAPERAVKTPETKVPVVALTVVPVIVAPERAMKTPETKIPVVALTVVPVIVAPLNVEPKVPLPETNRLPLVSKPELKMPLPLATMLPVDVEV